MSSHLYNTISLPKNGIETNKRKHVNDRICMDGISKELSLKLAKIPQCEGFCHIFNTRAQFSARKIFC